MTTPFISLLKDILIEISNYFNLFIEVHFLGIQIHFEDKSFLPDDYFDSMLKYFICNCYDIDMDLFHENIKRIQIYILCKEKNFYQVKETIMKKYEFLDYNLQLIKELSDIVSEYDNKLAGEILKEIIIKSKIK